MAIIEKDELIQNGLDRALELMAVAAHNSYRFKGRNNLKIITVGAEELEEIAEFCFSLGDMSPLAARDGRFVMELIKEPCGPDGHRRHPHQRVRLQLRGPAATAPAPS